MRVLSEDIIKKCRMEFAKVQNAEDFCSLLNFLIVNLTEDPNKMLYWQEIKEILSNTHTHYQEFKIKKKSGKYRIIQAPDSSLKMIQQCLNIILQSYYQPNDNACGFIPHRSIVDGAKQHIGKQYVFNIDLKDFFDQIDIHSIKNALTQHPFCLSDNYNQFSLPYIIAHLCCVEKLVDKLNSKGKYEKILCRVLPQGAPTSPILTNIICQQMDKQLHELSQHYNATYTRYADDITFSCNENIFDVNSTFSQAMRKIIVKDNNFIINKRKTRLRSHNYRQEVTGIVVNCKLNLTKQYIKQLRMWIYLWEHYGKERAQKYFIRDYLKNKENSKHSYTKIENVICGKLDYLKMILGCNSYTYQTLYKRYEKLIKTSEKTMHIYRTCTPLIV